MHVFVSHVPHSVQINAFSKKVHFEYNIFGQNFKIPTFNAYTKPTLIENVTYSLPTKNETAKHWHRYQDIHQDCILFLAIQYQQKSTCFLDCKREVLQNHLDTSQLQLWSNNSWRYWFWHYRLAHHYEEYQHRIHRRSVDDHHLHINFIRST